MGLKTSKPSHTCTQNCLGPLTFDCEAVGAEVHLSQGGRLAEKKSHTFKNGVVFTSRPVRVNERVRLRVENSTIAWHGALRVGFTAVSPGARPLPLPCMAIPNLTDRHGYWAAPVCEFHCQDGSELEFWVSSGGTVYIKSNGKKHKLLEGVSLNEPLWAMIDIYGQTSSVSLLGSKKRRLFRTRRSCPVPNHPNPPDVYQCSRFSPGYDNVNKNNTKHNSYCDTASSADKLCVVCLTSEARTALPCGHVCVCRHCFPRVMQEFNSCPLCRQTIIHRRVP